MSKIYQNNLNALLEVNPVLGAKLALVKPNENFELVQQGDDIINLNIIDKKNKYPVYETNPLKEIEQKQKEFKKFERYPALFLFGIGNGIFTKLLFSNPTHKKIYVFEPNLEILFIALNIVDLSEEIKSKKLEIIMPQDLTYAKALYIFIHKDVQLFAKTYELQIHSPYYEKFYSEEIIKLNKLLLRALKQTIINFGNDTIDTLIGIEHHIKNLPEMIKNPTFKQILKKKNSEVAIIVSTGPSLAKQLPLLKKIQDYVTIISVDASLPILAKEGIKPDFVTSLERVELTGKFFENTPAEFQKDIIMIHASLQHERVLKNSHGKKVLVMRPFPYTKYYRLHNYGYLGVGMSAANMAYELAYAMGYKTIALIGQDLAYGEDGNSHAKGHVLGENEVKFKDSDEYVTAYGGKGLIRTSRVWSMFKNFFERDIEYTKESGVKTFNCTEGGARIEGSIEIPFNEFIEKYVPKVKKQKITLRKPPKKSIEKNLKKAYKKTIEMEKYGEKIQKKIEKVFLQVAKECENLEKLKDENRLEEINFERLLKLTQKIDKIKDILETKKFGLMYGDTIQSYLVNKELDLAKIMVRPANTEIEKKAKMIEWIMQHKEWLFMLAGSINAQRIVIKRSLPALEEEIKKYT
jgi:hypothetical protein